MSAEDKYWTEFPSNRHKFFKLMIGDFRNQLRIPRKFVRKFKGSLSDTIHLRGPSRFVWTVKLARTFNDVFLQNGWEIFVRDHSLEEHDFLVFRYDENSTFNVEIFNKSACEKEASYFVKNQGSAASNGCFVSEKKGREEPKEVIDLDEILEKDRPKGKLKTGRGNQSSVVSDAINKFHQSGQNDKNRKQKLLSGDENGTSGEVEILPSKVDGKINGLQKFACSNDRFELQERGREVPEEFIHLDKVLEQHTQKGNRKRGRANQCSRDSGTIKRCHQAEATEKSRKQKYLRGSESETSQEVEILSFNADRKKKHRIQNENHFNVSGQCEMVDEEDSEECNATENWLHDYRKGKPKGDRDEMGKGSSSNKFFPFGSSRGRGQGTQSKNHVPLTHKSERKRAGIVNRTASESKKYSSYFQSNRREVTEEEKERPQKLAILHSSSRPSLYVVMKPTHVSMYFQLPLRRAWAAKHIPGSVQRVQLRVSPGKKWPVSLIQNERRRAFTRGWSKFVWDNNLEEDDVCVFELTHSKKSSKEEIVFDVIIFRVLDEIVPLRFITRARKP